MAPVDPARSTLPAQAAMPPHARPASEAARQGQGSVSAATATATTATGAPIRRAWLRWRGMGFVPLTRREGMPALVTSGATPARTRDVAGWTAHARDVQGHTPTSGGRAFDCTDAQDEGYAFVTATDRVYLPRLNREFLTPASLPEYARRPYEQRYDPARTHVFPDDLPLYAVVDARHRVLARPAAPAPPGTQEAPWPAQDARDPVARRHVYHLLGDRPGERPDDRPDDRPDTRRLQADQSFSPTPAIHHHEAVHVADWQAVLRHCETAVPGPGVNTQLREHLQTLAYRAAQPAVARAADLPGLTLHVLKNPGEAENILRRLPATRDLALMYTTPAAFRRQGAAFTPYRTVDDPGVAFVVPLPGSAGIPFVRVHAHVPAHATAIPAESAVLDTHESAAPSSCASSTSRATAQRGQAQMRPLDVPRLETHIQATLPLLAWTLTSHTVLFFVQPSTPAAGSRPVVAPAVSDDSFVDPLHALADDASASAPVIRRVAEYYPSHARLYPDTPANRGRMRHALARGEFVGKMSMGDFVQAGGGLLLFDARTDIARQDGAVLAPLDEMQALAGIAADPVDLA